MLLLTGKSFTRTDNFVTNKHLTSSTLAANLKASHAFFVYIAGLEAHQDFPVEKNTIRDKKTGTETMVDYNIISNMPF